MGYMDFLDPAKPDEDEMEENMTTYPKTANLMESVMQSTGFFCITPQVRRVSKQQKEQDAKEGKED